MKEARQRGQSLSAGGNTGHSDGRGAEPQGPDLPFWETSSLRPRATRDTRGFREKDNEAFSQRL